MKGGRPGANPRRTGSHKHPSNSRVKTLHGSITDPQVAYGVYDLPPSHIYRIGTSRPLREDCGIYQKHDRIGCCQIPYSASRAVRQS